MKKLSLDSSLKKIQEQVQFNIDNIFFKSQHLSLGNPTNARNSSVDTDPTNYLIERPQYALSFNAYQAPANPNIQFKVPNWVSWELNSSWHNGTLGRPEIPAQPKKDPNNNYPVDMSNNQYFFFRNRFPFEEDYTLPDDSWKAKPGDYINSDHENTIYDTGHLAASDDRKRDLKDQLATFLMSNILPIQKDTNRNGPWRGLEEYTTKLVDEDKKNLYIIAGGYNYKTYTFPNNGIDKTIPVPQKNMEGCCNFRP